MPNRIDTMHGLAPFDGWATALKFLDRLASAVVTAVDRSRRRAAERRLLAALDDRMLKDLGLNRCDVELEIRKRFWQE